MTEELTPLDNGDFITHDGFRLLAVNGGRYLVHAPAGFVDDLGSPITRPWEIPGKARAMAFVATIRSWQK